MFPRLLLLQHSLSIDVTVNKTTEKRIRESVRGMM